MATPLTDSINALTAYANEVTGGSDTNLSDAVHTLASGYGGGLNNWKTASIVSPNEIYQRADLIKEWLESVAPASSLALVISDKFKMSGPRTTRGNGSLQVAFIENGTATNYLRDYNGNPINSQNQWTSDYYLSVDANDSFTVLYKE